MAAVAASYPETLRPGQAPDERQTVGRRAPDPGPPVRDRRRLPDESLHELLREIAAETGGSLNPSIDELVARRGAKRLVRRHLDWLLVPLALTLMLADIALRMRLES